MPQSINSATAQDQLFGTASTANEDVPVINIALTIKGNSYKLPLAVFNQTYARTKATLDPITGKERDTVKVQKSESLSVGSYFLDSLGKPTLKNACERVLDSIYEVDPGPRVYENTHFYDAKITAMQCNNADVSKFITDNASSMQMSITRSTNSDGEIAYKCKIEPNTKLSANIKNVLGVLDAIEFDDTFQA